MDRSRLYKNRDKDSEELRRRRVDQSLELRRAKKEEQLQKRRNILLSELDETSPLKEKQIESIERVNYDTVIREMQNANEAIRFNAVQLCRKTLSRANNPPIEEFFKRGAVKILVNLLSEKSDPLVFEAAWALTNIASGETSHTVGVVECGAIPKLIKLLGHKAVNVAEQSVWALGNIAGEGAQFRDLLITSGIFEPVIKLLERSWDMPPVVGNIAWVLSNLCRNRNPPPPADLLKKILPVLKQLLVYTKNKDVIVDSAWALSYISDGANNLLDDIINSGCVNHLLPLLASDTTNIISPALRAVGNLVIGSDAQTQTVIDAGLLNYAPALLVNEKSNVVKEACWMISNITAGTVNQIQEVINHNIVPKILELLEKAEFRIQKEACWIISNIINGGSLEQCAYLMNQNVLPVLCHVLTVSDTKVIIMVLEAMRKLLELSKQHGQLDLVCIQMETCGGLDKLEELQEHENTQVYDVAFDILVKYFNEEGDDTKPDSTDAVAHVNPEQDEFKFIAPEQDNTELQF